MASKKFRELKGPTIVWLFATLYFAIGIASSRSSNGTLPQNITLSIVVNLLVAIARGWGVILVFLVIFLALYEKRRSLREILSSVGLKIKGSARSVLWSVALLPLLIIVGLIAMMLSNVFTPVSTSASGNEQIPLWYLWYMIIYSFFPVAVTEEAIARGYMLDRLMPQHPSSLVRATPAILLSSLLFTLMHVPSYLGLYSLSALGIVVLLAGNVFPISVILGIAYVRAGTRNISGLVLVHFLLDSTPIILSLVQSF